MRDYVLPAATFQQEFQLLAQAIQQTLYTCVVGPRRKVVKDGLSPSSETNYGPYDPLADQSNAFLALPAGEGVDDGSVEVRLDDVYGRYAQIGAADSIETTAAANQIALNAGFEAANRFAEFDDGVSSYDRLTGLGERDVRLGDHLKIVHEGGTLETQVSKLIQEQAAAAAADASGGAIAAADTNDSINPATQTLGINVTKIDDRGTGRISTDYGSNVASYDGNLAKGIVTDVYTLEVTKAGALGVAEATFVSTGGQSGTVVLSAAAAVGSDNLVLDFAAVGGDFVLGEKWTVEAKTDYTQKELTVVSEVYTGLVDTTYQIKVVKGGTYAENPKVSVTTNNNVDSSPSVVVVGDGDDVQLGSLGPVVEFTNNTDPQDGLRLGDIYLVRMTAAKDDGARTIQLRHPLPQLASDGVTAINAAGYDLNVTFMVKQDSHYIPASDYPDPGDINWAVAGDNKSIDIKAGIEITDTSVVDSTGDLLSLPVEKASVSIFYTAALTLEAGKLGIISSLSGIDDTLGDVVPENDVAFGVDMALRNSGGVSVYWLTTAGDTVADYTDALEEAEKNDDLYFMVPMSHDINVQSLFKSHVINMSSETNGLERIAVVNRTVADEKDLFVLRDDDTAWSGYIAAGPELSPVQYRQVTMPGAEFVTEAVEPGDILRVNFSISAGNEENFETYVIEEVIDEENLLIASGPEAAVGGVGNLHRIEIVHPYTSFEKAELAAVQSEFFGDRRVTNIYPDDFIHTNGETVPGFFMAAAYAGLKSSVVAHQPITNFELSGILSVPKVLNGFSRDELNEIAGGGTMIVGQELEGGKIFVRHQVTTDMVDTNHSELSITTNVDAITKYLRQWIKPLIGQYNINPEFLIMLETLAHQRLDFLIQETQTAKAGPQIVEVGAIRATQDPTVRTKVLMNIPLTLPNAANNIVTKLVIV